MVKVLTNNIFRGLIWIIYSERPTEMQKIDMNVNKEDNHMRTHIREKSLKKGSLIAKCSSGQTLNLRRFAPVGKGDCLVIDSANIFIELPNSRGLVQLDPPWKKNYSVDSIDNLDITIKEIETDEEYEGYLRLTDFHYRGAGGAGRRIPLVAVSYHWELPTVVGFIELTSSFLVNTARDKILDAPFSDAEKNVGWTGWDSKTAKVHGNSIVRISRCVVFPELRGVGLSRVLVKAAVEFSKERWHIAGVKPCFIEITAEMLRYWPFVESCGFHFVGETEGNRHRMVKDMQYLLGRAMKSLNLPQGGGGILSQQRSYAMILAEVMKRRNLSLPEIINYLQISPDKLEDEDWVQLHKVYRRPKPTYMKGLTDNSDNFIRRRSGKIKRPEVLVRRARPSKKQDLISIDGLNLSINCIPIKTTRGRRVQEAFGIVTSELCMSLVINLHFCLHRGEVILIGGPSGTGKSLLLKSIRRMAAKPPSRGRMPRSVVLEGDLLTKHVKISWPKPVPPDKAPVELLEDYSLEESLQILAAAGLAEAQLFVRPARTLSVGQSYRLALALAIAEKPDVLIVDEFCEPLDRFTTVAVSRNIRMAAGVFGMGIVVATADPGRVKKTLAPDKFLMLTSSGHHRWVSN